MASKPTLGDKTERTPTNETELIKSNKSLWNCDQNPEFSFRISALELDTSKRNTFTMSDLSESSIVHLEHWSKISFFPSQPSPWIHRVCCLLIHLGLLLTWIESKSSLQACEQTRNMKSLFSILMVLKYLINFMYHRDWGVDSLLKVNSIRRYLRVPIILMSCYCRRQMFDLAITLWNRVS